MREVAFAIPGDPATLTGGYLYARHAMAALPAAGWQPTLVSLPDSFPAPNDAALAATAAIFAGFSADDIVLVDGLAFGAIPAPILQRCKARLAALVHHPLCVESGLDADTAAQLFASERDALAEADAVITTSERTAQRVAEMFDVDTARITVALPGTAPAARAHGSVDATVTLLCVATLTPRKAHDVLIAALSWLDDLPWRLTCIGSVTRDTDTATALKTQIAMLDRGSRVALLGEKSGADLDAAYAGSDAFVLASRDEGYGMAFAEALARGLPIVACAAGAVPDTVPRDAGLLVPVDDVAALSQALRRLITDRALRKTMSDAAWAAGQRLPRWSDTAAKIGGALSPRSAKA